MIVAVFVGFSPGVFSTRGLPTSQHRDRAQANDPDYRGIHTFSLLKVSPAKIDIQYIDQGGVQKQTWN
jgi:hypothetical protein